MPSMTSRRDPRVPVRASGWPTPRMPRWLIVAIALFLAGCVAVALVHKPSQAERASDMRGFLQEVTSDVESCAAGVSESLQALHEVQAEHYDSSQDVTNGIGVAQDGAQNCAPANNEQIDDLQSYQVPESLDSFGLANAVNALVQWAAADAARVQTDVADVLSATTSQARSAAQAALSKDLVTLHAQGLKADGPMDKAIKALAMHASAPRLPS
jgi:hypothetical protein